jgi:hypothetical protein
MSKNTKPVNAHGRVNRGPKGIARQAKAKRRAEAAERQAAYNALSLGERRARLDGLTATRERARITAQMEKARQPAGNTK